jgi:hypothetical protein
MQRARKADSRIFHPAPTIRARKTLKPFSIYRKAAIVADASTRWSDQRFQARGLITFVRSHCRKLPGSAFRTTRRSEC